MLTDQNKHLSRLSVFVGQESRPSPAGCLWFKVSDAMTEQGLQSHLKVQLGLIQLQAHSPGCWQNVLLGD